MAEQLNPSGGSVRNSLTGVWSSTKIATLAPDASVAYVDMFHFRDRVNAPRGRDVGDRVLRTVAHRLQDGFAPNRVVRAGGDEFLIEFTEPLVGDAAVTLARRIGELVAEPIEGIAEPLEARVGLTLASVGHSGPIWAAAAMAAHEAACRDVPYIVESADLTAEPGFLTSAHGLPPTSLYTFGPVTMLWVGKRLELPDGTWPAAYNPRRFSKRPTFHGVGGLGDPEYQRIWRLVPDDPSSLRFVSIPDRWECDAATVVEEISPTTLMPAWEQVVTLCRRLAALTDDEVHRIATGLGPPDPRARPRLAEPVARYWVARAIWNAAQIADSPEHPVMYAGRAGGGWYEDITDVAWLRIEDVAGALADGLEIGTATLEVEGALFGPWTGGGLEAMCDSPGGPVAAATGSDWPI